MHKVQVVIAVVALVLLSCFPLRSLSVAHGEVANANCNYRVNGLNDDSLCWLDFRSAYNGADADPRALNGEGKPMTFDMGDDIFVSLRLHIMPSLPDDATRKLPSDALAPNGSGMTVREAGRLSTLTTPRGTRPLEAGSNGNGSEATWPSALFGHTYYLPKTADEQRARPVLGTTAHGDQNDPNFRDVRVRLTDIKVSQAGNDVSHYSLMIADGESTNTNEKIGFFAGESPGQGSTFKTKVFAPQHNPTCGAAQENLAGTTREGVAYSGLFCAANADGASGMVLAQASQPKWVEGMMSSTSLQGVAFGLMLDSVAAHVTVSGTKVADLNQSPTQFSMTVLQNHSATPFIKTFNTQQQEHTADGARAFIFGGGTETFTFRSVVQGNDNVRASRYVPTWRCEKLPESRASGAESVPIDSSKYRIKNVTDAGGKFIGQELSLDVFASGSYSCSVDWTPKASYDGTLKIFPRFVTPADAHAPANVQDAAAQVASAPTVEYVCRAPQSWAQQDQDSYNSTHPKTQVKLDTRRAATTATVIRGLPVGAACTVSGVQEGLPNLAGKRFFNLVKEDVGESRADDSIQIMVSADKKANAADPINTVFVNDAYWVPPVSVTLTKQVTGTAQAALAQQNWHFSYVCADTEAGLTAPGTAVTLAPLQSVTFAAKPGQWCRFSEEPLATELITKYGLADHWTANPAQTTKGATSSVFSFQMPAVAFNQPAIFNVVSSTDATLQTGTLLISRTEQGTGASAYRDTPVRGNYVCTTPSHERLQGQFTLLNAAATHSVPVETGSLCTVNVESRTQIPGFTATGKDTFSAGPIQVKQNTQVVVPTQVDPITTVELGFAATQAGLAAPEAFAVTAQCQNGAVTLPPLRGKWTGTRISFGAVPVGAQCTISAAVQQPAAAAWTGGDGLQLQAPGNSLSVAVTVGRSPTHQVLPPVTDSAHEEWTVVLDLKYASINLAKSIAGVAVQDGGGILNHAVIPTGGTEAVVTYAITNTGAAALTDVKVSDPQLLTAGYVILEPAGTTPDTVCQVQSLAAHATHSCTVKLALPGHPKSTAGSVDTPLRAFSTATVAGVYAPARQPVIAQSGYGLVRLPAISYMLPDTGEKTLLWVVGLGLCLSIGALWWSRREDSDH